MRLRLLLSLLLFLIFCEGCSFGEYFKCGEVNPYQCMMMADQLLSYEPTSEDIDRAVDLIHLGCSLGDGTACSRIAMSYFEQNDNDFENAEALDYFELGCSLGDSVGCGNVCRIKYQVYSLEDERVHDSCAYGCSVGSMDACYFLARHTSLNAEDLEGYLAAEKLFRKTCFQGIPDGCWGLGHSLVRGLAGTVDYSLAFDILRKACQNDSIFACGELGGLYFRGYGTDTNYERAIELLIPACESKHTQACSDLGIIYGDEDSTRLDYSKSHYYYELACAYDVDTGCYGMATNYVNGHGVDQNYELGASILKRLCKSNNTLEVLATSACHVLGLLKLGGFGVEQNLVEAQLHLDKSCKEFGGTGCLNLALTKILKHVRQPEITTLKGSDEVKKLDFKTNSFAGAFEINQTLDGKNFFDRVLLPAAECIWLTSKNVPLASSIVPHGDNSEYLNLVTIFGNRGSASRNSGQILLNTEYLSNIAEKRIGGEQATVALLAHEYVHLLQEIRLGVTEMIRLRQRLERQADFLAGWFLAHLGINECTEIFYGADGTGKITDSEGETADYVGVSLVFSEYGDARKITHSDLFERSALVVAGWNFRHLQSGRRLAEHKNEDFLSEGVLNEGLSEDEFLYLGVEAFSTMAFRILNTSIDDYYGADADIARKVFMDSFRHTSTEGALDLETLLQELEDHYLKIHDEYLMNIVNFELH